MILVLSMKKSLIFILMIFFINGVMADCSEGQININTASLEELDEIVWVGPATAEKIIAGRDFDSVDELIEVSGIGEIKIKDIKEQGLACVGDEQENNKIKKVEVNFSSFISEDKDKQEEVELETIKLTKDIKSEDNKKILDKSSYAKYGFVFFCVLLGLLLILKRKKFRKNELA